MAALRPTGRANPPGALLPLSWLASRNFPGTLFPMGCAAPAGSLVSVLVCGVLLRILAKKQAAEDSKAA